MYSSPQKVKAVSSYRNVELTSSMVNSILSNVKVVINQQTCKCSYQSIQQLFINSLEHSTQLQLTRFKV